MSQSAPAEVTRIATKSRRIVVIDIETVSTDASNSKGALAAISGQVICICILVDDGENITETSFVGVDEAVLLRKFWETIRPSDLFVGHNVLEFDLSFLRQRSWVNGIRPSREIDLRRFYSHDLVDTMHLWSNWGSTAKPSLDGLATVFGLRGKTAKGSNVADWWATGDLDSIADYCRADVRLTFEVFLKLTFQAVPERYFSPTLIAEESRNAEVIVHCRD